MLNADEKICENLPPNFYKDTTTQKAVECAGDFPTSSTAWVPTQPIEVQADTDCQFVCAEGRVISGKGSTGSCKLKPGYYSDNGDASSNSVATSCGTSHVSVKGWAADQNGVNSDTKCKIECAGNRIDNELTGASGECALPKGHVSATANGEADSMYGNDAHGSTRGWSDQDNRNPCKCLYP